MRELVTVALAIGGTELALRVLGVWPWITTGLQKWPSLSERYGLIFPFALFTLLLIFRKTSLYRGRLLDVLAGGIGLGLGASILSLLLAQLVNSQERANFWNGLQLEGGLSGTLVLISAIATFQTLGWLYGLMSFTFASMADRLGNKYID